MKRLVFVLGLVAALVGGGYAVSSAQETGIEVQHAHGTIAKGSTVCIGPISRFGGTGAVNLLGSTHGTSLTWQLLALNVGNPPVVISDATGTAVQFRDETTVADQFDACVLKTSGQAQDFDLTLIAEAIAP